MDENQNSEHGALDGWIDIFRTGKWTDSAGVTRDWTADHIDQIVRDSTPDNIPAVVGHPKTDAPAYAWAGALRRRGDRLQARLSDIDPGFRKLVEAGRFRTRSTALRSLGGDRWAVRHIGWLGAQAPAVPGLRPASFDDSGGEYVSHEFQDMPADSESRRDWYEFRAIRRMLQGVRDYIIERDGVEKADRVLPRFQIQNVGADFSGAADGADSTHTQSEEVNVDNENTNAGPGAAELAAREAAVDARIAEADRRDREYAERQSGQRLADAQAEIAAHVEAGRVLPAEKDRLAKLLVKLESGDDQAEIEFAEGDAVRRQKPGEIFRTFLSALPKRVEFRETSARETSADAGGQGAAHGDGEIAERATALHAKLRSEGVSITMSAAVDRVRRELGVEASQ